MKYISHAGGIKRTVTLILVGIAIILTTFFAIYKSLKIIYTNTKKEIAQQNILQISLIKSNLKNYLITNKNMMDSLLSTIPNVNPETLRKFVNEYLFKVEHEHIRNILFYSNGKLLLIYPHLSKTTVPINYIKGSKKFYKKIELANRSKRSLYFTAPMLNLSNIPKNNICLLLVHPIFIGGIYKGSLIESIDISSKLISIFKYFKNYSINLSYKPKVSKNTQEVSQFKIDKAQFYIEIKKKNTLLGNLKRDISTVTVNLIIIIFVSVSSMLIISFALTRKIRQEQIYAKTLSLLNKRIETVKSIIETKENFFSKSNIEKLLKTLKEVFNSDIAGIFMENQNLNYVLRDSKIEEIEFIKMTNSLSQLVWKSKKDMLVNDFQSRKDISQESKMLTCAKSAMCSLIRYGSREYGVICVGDTHKTKIFKEEDFNFLKLIANIIAINMYYHNLDKDAIEALLNAIEARDRYTEGHSRRVGEYAKFIAKILGFDETYQNNIYKAGLFHDVGKIGIPDVILLKPSRLSPNEYKIMKMHSVFSYEILKHVEMLSDVIMGIRGHHERWDGKGYPDGLKGENIPIEARILAIADSFDAIITSRPYKSAMTLNKAKQELIDNAGNQFDPEIIKKIEPHIEEMYNMGKEIEKQKVSLFPEDIEEIRKNIFFTDWLTGLLTIDKLERIVSELILENIEFSLCMMDIVNFSKIRYEFGKAKATDLILNVAEILKESIGENIARVNEDNFMFILKGTTMPDDMLEELSYNLTDKVGCEVIYTYVVYPNDGKNLEELLYRLKSKIKKVRKNKY